ncbi:MAG: VCBS domain-containing protein [Reyranella sp.]|uniref:VCBS domain-containing protein n=1 Tax=Reyranella sp. TaxID=1929291 RepID=UPI003D0BEECF
MLDDDDAAVQGLNDSDTLVERIAVTTAYGTTHTVLVAIEGRNDAAVLPPAVATVSSADAERSAGGTLTISDVDGPARHSRLRPRRPGSTARSRSMRRGYGTTQ